MVIPNAKKTVLKNGLTILTERIPSVRSAAVGILVGVGSGNETKDESGFSHFIEHMNFKGTKKRSAFHIAYIFDAIGGMLNAYTSKENTMYYAVVLDKHLDVAIEVLSDIFLNSTFDSPEIQLEKGVVLEEIKMYEDTPDELVHDFFAEKILHGHPMGKPIIGEKQAVKKMKRPDIMDFRKKWYSPRNTIIALAGAIPQNTVDLLRPYFEEWRGHKTPQPEIPHNFKGSVSLKHKKTEQVHLCLGVKGVSQVDEDRYPYAVLDNVLGGSMSSRLFQEIREKRGLAYSIFSASSPFRNFGITYVYAGTSRENFEQVIDLILKQFSLMKKYGVKKDELDRAKENLKGVLVLGLESTSARMSWLAKSEYYYGRSMTVEEIFKKVDKVTREDVFHLANKYFMDEYLTLAVIGDLDRLPVKEIRC